MVAFAFAVTDGLAKTPRRGFEATLARVGGTVDLNCAAQMLSPVVLMPDQKGLEQRFWMHNVMHLRFDRWVDT